MRSTQRRTHRGEETVEWLVADCRTLDAQDATTHDERAADLTRQIEQVDARSGKLLDSYLDGVVSSDAYSAKAENLARSRTALEQKLASLSTTGTDTSAQVAALASQAAGIRTRFQRRRYGREAPYPLRTTFEHRDGRRSHSLLPVQTPLPRPSAGHERGVLSFMVGHGGWSCNPVG